MDCEDFREALSVRLDDEEDAADAAQPVEEHLEQCGDCAAWYETAALITRRTRTTAAVAWPDVTQAVLAKVAPGTERRLPGPRLALAGVGVAECGLAVSTFAEGTGYQTGAWQLALGVAFGAVAARRAAPGGLVPLLGALVGTLALGQVMSLAGGAAAVSLVLAAAGLALVVLLGRTPPAHRAPRPPAAAATRTEPTVTADAETDKNDNVLRYLTIRVAPGAKSA